MYFPSIGSTSSFDYFVHTPDHQVVSFALIDAGIGQMSRSVLFAVGYRFLISQRPQTAEMQEKHFLSGRRAWIREDAVNLVENFERTITAQSDVYGQMIESRAKFFALFVQCASIVRVGDRKSGRCRIGQGANFLEQRVEQGVDCELMSHGAVGIFFRLE